MVLFLFTVFICATAKIECDHSRCLQSYLSDNECDHECNNALCGFDQSYEEPSIYNSDCSNFCFSQTSCKERMLSNGVCDEDCSSSECGYDWGDCGYCDLGCFESMLGNGVCDEACNTAECSFDDFDCVDSECSPGCKVSMIDDHECQPECQVEDCNQDGRDCDSEDSCSYMCQVLSKNGVCDEACNTPVCNWDGGECECSPGCTPEIRKLTDATCTGLNPCNTAACSWHDGRCGDCNADCFSHMLSNGVCDAACVVKSCNYDQTDCKHCSPGCESITTCKSECMTLNCIWGDTCYPKPNKLLYRSVQALKRDWNYIDVDAKCRKTGCDLDRFYTETYGFPDVRMFYRPCIQSCNNPECAYSLGGCHVGNCAVGCSICYGPGRLQCFMCYRGYAHFYHYCLRKCPDSYTLTTLVCVYTGIATESNPDKYYISEQPVASYTVYQDLTYVLAFANGKYQRILLAPGEHQLKLLDHTKYDQLFYIPNNRPLYKPDYELAQISIEPWMCLESEINASYCYRGQIDPENMPIIHWNSLVSLEMPKNSRLIIKNINLLGKYNLITTDILQYADYCPFMRKHGDKVKDQRDQVYKTSQIPSEDICKKNHDTSIFVLDNASLRLENVIVSEFRMEPHSVIKAKGVSGVKLNNVNFEKIRVGTTYSNSSVIAFSDCPEELLPYNCGLLEYDGGKIYGLNDGYELDDSVILNGFIYGANLWQISIKNLDFSYNLIQSFNPYTSGLINLGNFRQLEMYNCTFTNSVFAQGIVNFQGPFDTEIPQIHSNILEDDFLTHIKISDITISDSYSSDSLLLDLTYEYLVHNIQLESITISRSISNSILKFKSELNSASMRGGYHWVHVDKKNYYLELSPKYCKVTDLKIIDSNTGNSGIIESEGYGNILFDTLDLNNEYASNTTFESIIRDPFRLKEDLYLNRTGLITPKVYNLGIVNNFNRITIQNTTISYHSSLKSSCFKIGLQYLSWNRYIEILDSRFYNIINSQENEATVLCIMANKEVRIENSVFESNRNDNGWGAVMLESERQVSASIESSIFSKNSGLRSGGLHMNIAGECFISNTRFESNTAFLKSGGAIYIEANKNKDSYYKITDTIFSSNYAAKYGGGLSVENPSQNPSTITLIIEDSSYHSNYSVLGGSSISLMHSTRFLESHIKSTTFKENSGSYYGTIYIENLSPFTISSCTFQDNLSAEVSAIYITSGSLDLINFRLVYALSLEDSIFMNNSGNSVISQDGVLIRLLLISYRNVFKNNQGSVFKIYKSDLMEDSSSFLYNSAESGAVVKIFSESTASFTGSVMEGNKAETKGGVVFASWVSKFECYDCRIEQNETEESGAVIYIEQQSYFKLENCEVNRNIAKKFGSVVYMNSSSKPASEIVNTRISYNEAESGTFHMHDSNLDISYSEVSYNKAVKDAGFEIAHSTINCNSTLFSGHFNSSSLYFYASYSELSILESEFSQGGESEIGAIGIRSSYLNVTNSSFRNITSDSAAVLKAEEYSKVEISNCSIRDVSVRVDGAILSTDSEISITYSEFYNNTGGLLLGDNLSKLAIKESIVSRSINTLPYPPGIVYCNNCDEIEIAESRFEYNIGSTAGALCSRSVGGSEMMIRDSYFINNTALLGGAVVSENTNFTVYGTLFQNNTVMLDKNGGYQDRSGKGGALFILCEENINCDASISNSSFNNNIAELEGGAISCIKLSDRNSSCFTNDLNKYSNNKALYGGQVASIPKKLLFQLTRVTPREELGSYNTFLSIAAAQQLEGSLFFNLIDERNQTIRSDSRSICDISIYNSSQPASILGMTKAIANKGMFEFPNLTFYGEPNSTISLQAKSYGYIYEMETQIQLNSIINIQLRDCKPGEFREARGCFKCESGTFSLTPDEECKKCPENAKCSGQFSLLPEKGYWRSSSNSEQIYRCPNPDACDGAKDDNVGGCSEGYESNLCHRCAYGYGRVGTNVCAECGEFEIILVIFWIYAAMFAGFICITAYSAIWNAYKEHSILDVYLRIFINYCQLLMILNNYHFNWISTLLNIISPNLTQEYNFNKSYSIECLFDLTASFYTILGIHTVFPVILSIVISFTFGLSYLILSLRGSIVDNVISKIICTVVATFFFLYPFIIEHALQAFSCTEIEEGEYWLNYDMSIRCWDDDHLKYALGMGLPIIIIWGILTPTISFILLIRHKKSMNTFKTKLKFGLIYFGFSDKKYCWEFMILFRKLVLITLSVFVGNYSRNAQALMILAALIIYLYIQLKAKPYITDDLNSLETYYILVSAVTVYAGLYDLTVDISKFYYRYWRENSYYTMHQPFQLLILTTLDKEDS